MAKTLDQIAALLARGKVEQARAGLKKLSPN